MSNALATGVPMAPKGGEAGGRLLGGREPATCSVATLVENRLSHPANHSLGIASRVRSPQLACPLDAVRTVIIRLVPHKSGRHRARERVRTMELLVGRDLLILSMLALGITLAILGLRLTRR